MFCFFPKVPNNPPKEPGRSSAPPGTGCKPWHLPLNIPGQSSAACAAGWERRENKLLKGKFLSDLTEKNIFFTPFYFVRVQQGIGEWRGCSGGGGFGGKNGVLFLFLAEWTGLMAQVLFGSELRMFSSSAAKKDRQWLQMQESEHGNVAEIIKNQKSGWAQASRASISPGLSWFVCFEGIRLPSWKCCHISH